MPTTIIRTARPDRYTIVHTHTIEDSRLSWTARGLLIYLLSKPDDWKVIVKELQRRGDLGRDGVYRLLQELRSTGYMNFVKHRAADGRIRGGTYYVFDTPGEGVSGIPHPELPETVKPDTAEPDPVNP